MQGVLCNRLLLEFQSNSMCSSLAFATNTFSQTHAHARTHQPHPSPSPGPAHASRCVLLPVVLPEPLISHQLTRVVQASREVRGRSLEGVVAAEDWHAVNNKSLGRTFLLNLLLVAQDAKGDNYMVTEDGTIVGIDNDHILEAPVMRCVSCS